MCFFEDVGFLTEGEAAITVSKRQLSFYRYYYIGYKGGELDFNCYVFGKTVIKTVRIMYFIDKRTYLLYN